MRPYCLRTIAMESFLSKGSFVNQIMWLPLHAHCGWPCTTLLSEKTFTKQNMFCNAKRLSKVAFERKLYSEDGALESVSSTDDTVWDFRSNWLLSVKARFMNTPHRWCNTKILPPASCHSSTLKYSRKIFRSNWTETNGCDFYKFSRL